MKGEKWIIEARNPDGSLDLGSLQPEVVFGAKAITGMTADQIASAIYRFFGDSWSPMLSGTEVETWPSYIDRRWTARRKTWA